MNKPITLIACFIFFLLSGTAFAQDELKIAEDKDSKKDTKVYVLRSLDGKKQTVHIMPDYAHLILRISCHKDTITIHDYWGVPSGIKIFNETFMVIEYEIRGGSNFALGNTLILCVNNFKLCEAAHVLRYTSTDGYEKRGSYKIKMALVGNNVKTYKLNISVHDKVVFYSHPENNFNYNSQTVLNFDVSRNVFYSIKEDMYGNFITYSQKGKKHKLNVEGNFPGIILGTETYYFINNRWYELAKGKELSEFD